MMSSLSTSIKPSATLYERPGCPDHEHLRARLRRTPWSCFTGRKLRRLDGECHRGYAACRHSVYRVLSKAKVMARDVVAYFRRMTWPQLLCNGPAVVQFPHERRLDRADPAGENLGHNCTFDAGSQSQPGAMQAAPCQLDLPTRKLEMVWLPPLRPSTCNLNAMDPARPCRPFSESCAPSSSPAVARPAQCVPRSA